MHESWLIAWFSLALIGGIALAFRMNGVIFSCGQWLVVAVMLMFVAVTRRTVAMVLLAVIAGLLLGLWRGEGERAARLGYQPFIGQTVSLRGAITDDVTRKNGQAGLKLRKVQVNGKQLGGNVWAGSVSGLDLKRNDQVILQGKLKPGFGTFAASLSYASLTVAQRPAHGDIPREIRDRFGAGLKRAIPQPAAALGIGYLTGQHNDLPVLLRRQLQLVGLIHIVIAGGYNVTVLVRFARRTLIRVSKYLAALSSSAILLGLTLVAGFTAPMARTAVVTGLSLLAWYYGRRIHPFVLLPVAAAITAMADPSFVRGDVGWYLTFVAYGGLIVLAPMLKRFFWQQSESGALKQIFVDTLSVQIVTMPLMAFAFQQYSIYGLPANLLVLPFMTLTMLATAAAGLAGMALPPAAAHVIGWPAAALLGYTDKVTVRLATAPGAGASASLTVPGLVLVYAAILFVIYGLWLKTHYDFREANIVD